MMESISAEAEGCKPSGTEEPTLNRTTQKHITMSNESKTSPEYSAVTATLGLKDDCQPKDVMARISELISIEARFREKEKEPERHEDRPGGQRGHDTESANQRRRTDRLAQDLSGPRSAAEGRAHRGDAREGCGQDPRGRHSQVAETCRGEPPTWWRAHWRAFPP